MSYYVPDFDMDEDYSIHTSDSAQPPALTPPKKSSMPDDEIVELLWHNGQVVMQSQNQRSFKKSPPSRFQDPESAGKEIRHSDHLFMQEDEMVSWLQYDPPFEHDFCADLLYPSSSVTATTTTPAAPTVRPLTEPRTPLTTSAFATASRPPVPPIRTPVLETPSRIHNFPHFGRHIPMVQKSATSNSKSVVRETTVVDSSITPSGRHDYSRVSLAKKPSCSSETASGWNNHQSACETMTASREIPATTCDATVSSSPGGSSGSAELATQMAAEDRKRKVRESEETDCPSEDVDFESGGGGKKKSCGSSAKRSRAAEVHNLSERRRRDRINEKMKALQELIPRCNKSDKASMLDEAIEYLKSLQMQVQMMSMGCGMVPMMFPGIQQYMPSMGMGIGMGMGMGMDMAGMSRPMLPFPNVLAGASQLTTSAAAAHLAPRYPVQAFAVQPPVPGTDPSRIHPNSQPDTMFNPFGMQGAANLPRGPPFPDPYQQYIGLQPMQQQPPQNQTQAQAAPSRPSTSRTVENSDIGPPDEDKL